ncbi:MAG: hemerythrin domain-containing protein [Chloroflexi bacterium]|nr:hemerythrin domain-containing protein [Chloroflexota bacterium]
MNASDQLKEEHTIIKLVLQILEKVSQKLDAGEKVDPKHLAQIVDFIRVFADRCHHGKEEDVLFPELEAAGIPRTGGPVGVMLTEHDTGRGYVRGMAEASTRYETGNHQAAASFAKNARGYINLLTQHIDKEDNILYPMGDARFSAEKQQEILVRFERIEDERIGAGKHEEFHELVHRLRDIYLK